MPWRIAHKIKGGRIYRLLPTVYPWRFQAEEAMAKLRASEGGRIVLSWYREGIDGAPS